MNEYYSGPKSSINPENLDEYCNANVWSLEPKIDGMWVQLTVGTTKHTFTSRAGLAPAPEYIRGLQNMVLPLSPGSVLCGELECGTDRATQRYKESGYYSLHLFDVINYQGTDLRDTHQKGRRAALEAIYNEIQFASMHIPGRIQIVPSFTNLFKHRYDYLVRNGGEGIVLKRTDAKYGQGKNDTMVRCKATATDDFVLMDIGKTDSGDLTGIWGQYHNGQLVYVMRAQPRANMYILRPESIGVVAEFKGWGHQSSGTLRSAQFVRTRTDKTAQECLLNNIGDSNKKELI